MVDNPPEILHHRTFRNRSLRESRFIGCDLGEVVIRGSDVGGLEVDSPWLMEGGAELLVNGVDVVPLVDAALNHRFPGRELRRATDRDGLRAAWAAVEHAWAATLDRATGMSPGTADTSVDGEWSLMQTLRHLVMATDTWLGRAILHQDQPYHPVGLPNDDHDSDAYDDSVFSARDPSRYEILTARADRQARVRDFIAQVTSDQLASARQNPHSPEHGETVLSCLHTILEEEWEHHRYAVRDLSTLAESDGPTP